VQCGMCAAPIKNPVILKFGRANPRIFLLCSASMSYKCRPMQLKVIHKWPAVFHKWPVGVIPPIALNYLANHCGAGTIFNRSGDRHGL